MKSYANAKCEFLHMLFSSQFGVFILYASILQTTPGTSLESPSNITAYNQSSTSIVVTWDSLRPDILKEHNITGYRVRYAKKSGGEEEGDHFLCTISNTTILENLTVFTKYCIEVASFTRSRMDNHSQCLVATTDEEAPIAPPQNLSAINTSSTSLRVTWAPLPLKDRRGIILGYKIVYNKTVIRTRGSRSNDSGELSVNGTTLELTIDGLQKFTNYCIRARAFNSKGEGNYTEDECLSTDEDVPSHPPLNVTAFNTSSSSLYVQWTSIPSELIPGILLGYRLFYWKIGEPSSVKDVPFNNSVLNAELKDLQEHTEYCIQLAGFTRIGDGNRSECFKVTTDIGETVAVPETAAVEAYSPTSIKVTWTLPAKSQGTINGFHLHIKEKESLSQESEVLFEDIIAITNASQTYIVIRNLSIFTKYEIRMAAYNTKINGSYSSPIFAETCRCPKYLPTATKPSSLEKGGKGGITDVIAQTVKKTCGFCVEHGRTELVPSNTNDTWELPVQFPVTLTSLPGSSFSVFVPVLDVPGVAVLRRQGDKAAQRYYEKVMTGSLMDAWPVVTLTVLMVYTMGVMVWFLDAKQNPKPDELSWSFVKGAYEGSWWAFITMATVGYGDRCVKSNRARILALVWMIGSLVLLPFLFGAITTILTVTVMETRITLPRSEGNKAAAITNSAEAKLAMGRLSSKLKLTTTYSSIEALAQSLKEGEVDYILVDAYIPKKRNDLFNGSWFEVVALLRCELYHGAVLQGEALKLAPALKEMIAYDNVQTKFLQDDEPAEEEQREKESLFFDPSSPFFQFFLYVSSGILGFFIICGGLYQVIYIHRTKKSRSDLKIAMEKYYMYQELRSLVDEFYHSIRHKYEVMKKKHRLQLLKLGRKNGKHNC
ncbi:receptor-type tyrosine-protein phosphatase S-like isoform X1 [Montipora foliosa]|uniref:receptor-type tyrosine-protein phosphatase S-like isoform X1 n=1 Tax=Montipora foliosa TaxID=591990 RepID=UPI0035F1F63C